MQIEGDFIPYQPAATIEFDWTYSPFTPSNMVTVPATHPRLSAWFTRIGDWFKWKGEAWGEHKYYVVKERFEPTITFGDYTHYSDEEVAEEYRRTYWSMTGEDPDDRS